MMEWAELEPQLVRLKRALDQADAAEAVAILLKLVSEFTPQTWTGEPAEQGARILHLPPRKAAPSAA